MPRYVINGVEVPVDSVSATALTPIAPPELRLPHVAPNDPSAPPPVDKPNVGGLAMFAALAAVGAYVILKKSAKSAPSAPKTA